MAKIDTNILKEFRLDSVFIMRNTKSIVQKDVEPDSGLIPYVTASNSNNGVLMYIDCPPEWVDEGDCIMIGGKTMTFSYQKEPFCSNDSHNIALYLKDKTNATEMCYLYLITALRSALYNRYSWGDSVSMKRIKDDVFFIPATTDGSPDFVYMDAYMRNVMNESKTILESLRRAEMSKTVVDTTCWKEYRVGDLFTKLQLSIKKQSFNKKLDVSEVRTDEFNLPLVNAKHGNNGIMYYGRENDFESAEMTIDIVQNGAIATGDVYAQPQKTGVLWDAYLVKPTFEVSSPNVLMFLANVLENSIKHKFSYNDKCIWDKVKQLTVKLPSDSTGNPDVITMDRYISDMLASASANLDALVGVVS